MEDILAIFLAAASVSGLASLIVDRLVRGKVKPDEPRRKAIAAEVDSALSGALQDPPVSEQLLQPTNAGEEAARAIIRSYMRELMAESSRIAKRLGAESASPRHVSQAAERIGVMRSRTSVWTDSLLGVGTLLVGAAASYQISLATGGTADSHWGLPMALIFGLGIGLAVTGVTLKVKSR